MCNLRCARGIATRYDYQYFSFLLCDFEDIAIRYFLTQAVLWSFTLTKSAKYAIFTPTFNVLVVLYELREIGDEEEGPFIGHSPSSPISLSLYYAAQTPKWA